MPKMPRILLEGACYHIITRGNQRQRIFVNESDYLQYLQRVKYYKIKFKFRLYGYCLMPNHVHLLGEIEKPCELSKFMQGINRSYTAYVNKRYKKIGHLWQGRFKSKVILKDKYLLDCITYIETNPIRANMVDSIKDYRYSSYIERNLGIPDTLKVLDDVDLVGTLSTTAGGHFPD